MEKLDTKNLWLNFTNSKNFDKSPLIIERGEECYVYDTNGEKYLDAISGIWNAALGYSRKDIVKEINVQMNKLPLTPLFGRAYPLLIEYTNKLLSIVPEFAKVFYGTGGSDSVETALKLARLFYYKQGKYDKTMIGHFNMSYHGVTSGEMNVMGEKPNTEGCVLDKQNYFTLPLPDDESNNIFELLDGIDSNKIAAIIVEPIIGSGGIIEFSNEFMKRLRQYTIENDILLIFDEVVTGFGRTGSMFAYQDIEVVPDILVLAKGITAGYAPLGATLFSKDIASVFDNEKVRHGYSNAGAVSSIAAANKVLDIFNEENILENVKQRSINMREYLNGLQRKHNTLIKKVKGRGLMIGVELCEKDGQELDFFYQLLGSKKVLSRSAFNNTVVLMPPLSADKKFIEELNNRVGECFDEYSKRYK